MNSMNSNLESLINKSKNISIYLMLDLYNNQQSYNGLGEFLRETTINLNWRTDWFSLSKNLSGNYWLIHIDGKLFYLLPIKDKVHNDGEFSKFFHQSSFNPDYKLINTPILEHSVGDSFKVYKKGDIAPRSTTDSYNAREQPTPQSKEVNFKAVFEELKILLVSGMQQVKNDLLTELRQPKAIEYDRSQEKTVSVSAEIQELKKLIFSEFEGIRAADNTNILSRISQLESKIDSITDSFSAMLNQSNRQAMDPISTQSAIVLEDAYEQPLNTELNTPYDREKYSTGQETESQNPELQREIQNLLQYYHQNPDDLERRYSIGVSETRESFEKRWSGLNVPIVLEGASNYNFIIVSNYYLLPKPNSKITQTKLNTIDGLFEYQNFRSGAPFQVIQPAIVTAMEGDRWQVTQKGKLNFLN